MTKKFVFLFGQNSWKKTFLGQKTILNSFWSLLIFSVVKPNFKPTPKSPPPHPQGHWLFLFQKPWVRDGPTSRTPVPARLSKFQTFQALSLGGGEDFGVHKIIRFWNIIALGGRHLLRTIFSFFQKTLVCLFPTNIWDFM